VHAFYLITHTTSKFNISANMGAIDLALAALQSSEVINYAATAKEYGVDRSTLSRRHRGVTGSKAQATDTKSLLTHKQQLALVAYIDKLTLRGLPPTNAMVRLFAKEISKKEPGKNWVRRFVSTHSQHLNSSYLSGIDTARRRADNVEQYKLYFELVSGSNLWRFGTNILQLARKIAQYKILPENIYNMDEKGFLIGYIQKTKRVFTHKHLKSGKLIGAAQDGNREWVTVLGTICQDGSTLPPSIIYQAISGNIQDTWVDEFDPTKQQAYFASSSTGWTNENLAFEWLTTIFQRHTKAKARQGRSWRLLLVDGHNSHLNMRFLEWAEHHKIAVAVYPPHSTHRLQPLDVSLYGPLQSYYSTELTRWIQDTQGLSRLTKRDFFSLFWTAWTKAFTSSNIKSGWATTGLYPFDAETVIALITPRLVPAQQRRNSTDSSSTVSSELDWRQARSILKKLMGPNLDRRAMRLVDSIEIITTRYELVKAENEGLRRGITAEKNRRKRGQPLFEQLRADSGQQAMFFSPNKVQEARDLATSREQVKQQLEAQKAQDKLNRLLVKEAKEKALAERKVARNEAKIRRDEAAAQKKQEKLEAKQQREVDLQLTKELKHVHISSKSKPQPSASRSKEDKVPNKAVKVSEVQNLTERPRRERKAPKYLDSFEICTP
jgi:hypothetical protein